jgi:hypothetical protein
LRLKRNRLSRKRAASSDRRQAQLFNRPEHANATRGYATGKCSHFAPSFFGMAVKEHGEGLLLSTCWPFDAMTSGTERYVLHATLIEAAG